MADKIEYGGSAFPHIEKKRDPAAYPNPVYHDVAHSGMSLRDWFAGQALSSVGSFWSDAKTRGTYAKRAYQMADAMIKAREGEL